MIIIPALTIVACATVFGIGLIGYTDYSRYQD